MCSFDEQELYARTKIISQQKFIPKADQICYSVLCVFSYMAAGQEQKKAAQLSPKPQHKNQPKLQTQPQPPQQQKQQHLPSQNTTSPTITKPQQKPTQPLQQAPQQPQQTAPAKPQTVTIKQTIQPQKPLVTTSAVQPPAQHPPVTSSTSVTQPRSVATASITTKVTEQIKSKLPQLPPRVQSQNSVTSRGPPPAIPPRSANAPPLPNRSESVQIPSRSEEPSNRALIRQTSVNSIPPQYTPQPPPKFVIPQRQNSRTSLGRHNSVSGPSSGSPTSTGGSPQMTRKH